MAGNSIVSLTVAMGQTAESAASIKKSRLYVKPFVSKLKLPTVLRLEVTLDTVPKSSHGITFGKLGTCDVVLPAHPFISKVHFSLTFDEPGRLIVTDTSKHGTEVTYQGSGLGIRKNRHWILNDPVLPAEYRHIEICVAKVIKFRVDVGAMRPGNPIYNEAVARFRANLPSPGISEKLMETALAPTDGSSNALASDDTWIVWNAAKGGSSDLLLRWNSRDGSIMCIKQPKNQSQEATDRWKHEKDMLVESRHHHVVELLDFQDTICASPPYLQLEYLRGGTLEDAQDNSPFSRHEIKAILGQCLSALIHMHTLNPPICHRDIKPANVLINRRTESYICVKIADFGEAKIESKAKTAIASNSESSGYPVGDIVYSAPEVFESTSKGICKRSLDIFSLGLTTLRMIDPELMGMYGPNQEEFFKALDRSEDEMVQFLREHMLIKDEAARSSASECLDHLQRLQEDGDSMSCGCGDCSPCGGSVLHDEDDQDDEEEDDVSTSTNGQDLNPNAPMPTPSVEEPLERVSLEQEVQSSSQTTPVQVPGAHLDTDQISPTSGGDLTPICDITPLKSIPTTDISQEASPEGDAYTAEKTPHQGVKRPAESDSEGSQVNKRVRSKSPETPFGEQM